MVIKVKREVFAINGGGGSLGEKEGMGCGKRRKRRGKKKKERKEKIIKEKEKTSDKVTSHSFPIIVMDCKNVFNANCRI